MLALLLPLLLTTSPPAWDPLGTWVVIASSTRWADPELEAFSPLGRKDEVLAEALALRGVPIAQREVLLDRAATAESTLEALAQQVAEAPRGATFVFYFQGHGLFDGTRYVLATADADTSRLSETGLGLSALFETLSLRTSEDRVLLLGDACNSGHLGALAAALTFAGIPALALTSADARSSSSASWVFTEALVDGLRGRALLDLDGDGRVTLLEVAAEARAGMRFREGQPIGLSRPSRAFADLTLGPSAPLDELLSGPREATLEMRGDRFGRGDWVLVQRLDGRRDVARILGAQRGTEGTPTRLRVEYEDDNARLFGWAREDKADPIVFERWPIGTLLRIEDGDALRQAEVIASDDGLHLVRYHDADGGEAYVAPDAIAGPVDATKDHEHVLYERNGTLLEAVVKTRVGDEVCLRLRGGHWHEDPCVPAARVRPLR